MYSRCTDFWDLGAPTCERKFCWPKRSLETELTAWIWIIWPFKSDVPIRVNGEYVCNSHRGRTCFSRSNCKLNVGHSYQKLLKNFGDSLNCGFTSFSRKPRLGRSQVPIQVSDRCGEKWNVHLIMCAGESRGAGVPMMKWWSFATASSCENFPCKILPWLGLATVKTTCAARQKIRIIFLRLSSFEISKEWILDKRPIRSYISLYLRQVSFYRK